MSHHLDYIALLCLGVNHIHTRFIRKHIECSCDVANYAFFIRIIFIPIKIFREIFVDFFIKVVQYIWIAGRFLDFLADFRWQIIQNALILFAVEIDFYIIILILVVGHFM